MFKYYCCNPARINPGNHSKEVTLDPASQLFETQQSCTVLKVGPCFLASKQSAVDDDHWQQHQPQFA
jgi:hypothetical protein